MLVFLTRYLDLFWSFISLYNTMMKIFFISTSVLIVYLIKFKRPYSDTYDKAKDVFFLPFIIVPCLVLALLINEFFTLTEILWTFSLYVETVAILPQLIVVHNYAQEQNGFVETLTSHYVFCLGAYRALYLLNWVYRFLNEPEYRDWIVWVTGLIQTAIYMDFFYYYLKGRVTGTRMTLPI